MTKTSTSRWRFFGVQKLNVPELVDAMDAANRLNDKPLIVAWMHGHAEGPRMLRERGIPCLRDPLHRQ